MLSMAVLIDFFKQASIIFIISYSRMLLFLLLVFRFDSSLFFFFFFGMVKPPYMSIQCGLSYYYCLLDQQLIRYKIFAFL